MQLIFTKHNNKTYLFSLLISFDLLVDICYFYPNATKQKTPVNFFT